MNDKRLYCQRQANREFFGDSPAGVRQEGYLEEVDGLTPEALTEAYYEMLRTANIELIVLGCDEASTTAELFGAEMALANNLLALVQQYVRAQSDRLWLEPDFTGERAGERIVSFRLTSCAAVLLWLVIRLLHRLWKDPQLQPAAKA